MMMTDDNRPSIAELQRVERAMTPADWEWNARWWEIHKKNGEIWDAILSGGSVGYDNASMSVDEDDARGVVALRNAAPVLLEIAVAAMALKEAGVEGDEVIQMMNAATNADEYCAACTLAPRVEERRIAALRDLDAALAKVRQ